MQNGNSDVLLSECKCSVQTINRFMTLQYTQTQDTISHTRVQLTALEQEMLEQKMNITQEAQELLILY